MNRKKITRRARNDSRRLAGKQIVDITKIIDVNALEEVIDYEFLAQTLCDNHNFDAKVAYHIDAKEVVESIDSWELVRRMADEIDLCDLAEYVTAKCDVAELIKEWGRDELARDIGGEVYPQLREEFNRLLAEMINTEVEKQVAKALNLKVPKKTGAPKAAKPSSSRKSAKKKPAKNRGK